MNSAIHPAQCAPPRNPRTIAPLPTPAAAVEARATPTALPEPVSCWRSQRRRFAADRAYNAPTGAIIPIFGVVVVFDHHRIIRPHPFQQSGTTLPRQHCSCRILMRGVTTTASGLTRATASQQSRPIHRDRHDLGRVASPPATNLKQGSSIAMPGAILQRAHQQYAPLRPSTGHQHT